MENGFKKILEHHEVFLKKILLQGNPTFFHLFTPSFIPRRQVSSDDGTNRLGVLTREHRPKLRQKDNEQT